MVELSDDVEFCDVCGDPVDINNLRDVPSVPLCFNCWLENQRGE